MSRPTCAALVLASLLLIYRLPAQVAVPVPLDSGTLVRMTPTSGDPFEGRLIQRFPPQGSLLRSCRYPGPPCTDDRDSTRFRQTDLASLRMVEVQRGNHAGSGAAIGGVVGALLGGVFGGLAQSLCETQSCAHAGQTGAITLGVAGAVFGALFGAASPRWGRP